MKPTLIAAIVSTLLALTLVASADPLPARPVPGDATCEALRTARFNERGDWLAPATLQKFAPELAKPWFAVFGRYDLAFDALCKKPVSS